jgi:hypothetical protein
MQGTAGLTLSLRGTSNKYKLIFGSLQERGQLLQRTSDGWSMCLLYYKFLKLERSTRRIVDASPSARSAGYCSL